MARIKPKIKMNSSTTIRTFMIGTIEMIEKEFGEIFGHGKADEDLTDEEYEKWEKFLEIRERILDLGNDLIHTKAAEITETKNGKTRRSIYGK